MILNIILQISIGISALLVVYLDYKWYDKRKLIFKNARKYLIFITVIIIGLSIITTVQQDNEKRDLSDGIDNLLDSISSINKIAINLNNQIEPFLKLAMEKYPDLPINEALENLQTELNEIQKKTKKLELKEQYRKEKEIEFVKLKETAPDIKFEMALIKKDLVILITFNNQVPIKMRPFLQNLGPWECGTNIGHYIFSKAYSAPIVIYPPNERNKKYIFVFDSIEEGEELPKDKQLCLRMNIWYSSIYADEIQDSELKEKKLELDYIIEPLTNKFIPIKFSPK